VDAAAFAITQQVDGLQQKNPADEALRHSFAYFLRIVA
jgi:hypothetical protein